MESTMHFRLKPFASGPVDLSLTGSVARETGAIQIEFQVKGALDKILWPGSRQSPERCHGLWRQTCFELFFAIKGDSAYWEVNLSPNMCWNVYHFTEYRRDMREEELVPNPVCHVVRDADLLSCTCTLDCNGLIDDSSVLEAAISSVIRATDGSTSYWAITHHGTEPDFHDRESFSMVLSGVKKR